MTAETTAAPAILPENTGRNGGDIPPVEVKCRSDEFENHIRSFGVVYACEWFGHHADSEFTAETIRFLRERSAL